MDDIKQWALTACISAILSGIILHFVPDGSMKKYAGALCFVFVTAVFLLPVGENFQLNIPDAEDYTINEEKYESEINREALEYVKKQLCNSVITQAEEENISIKKIDIDLDTASVTNVKVKSVIIYGEYSLSQTQSLQQLISELFGTEVKTLFEN